MKNYNKENIPLAKILRKNMTVHEKKLWYDFLRHASPRFQRQKAIGNYIADFYCAKAKLIVELDGSGHHTAAQFQADQQRTKELQSMGMHIIRFQNSEIEQEFAKVCRSIRDTVELLAPSDEGAGTEGD